MKREDRFTIRLPQEFRDELESIRVQSGEKSISAVLRKIILDSFEERRSHDRLRMLEKRLTKRLDNLEDIIAKKW